MPYKDPRALSAFQAEWIKQRRRDFLATKGPCAQCGSTDDLEVLRVTPGPKIHWGCSHERLERDMKHFVVLCKPCRLNTQYASRRRDIVHGTASGYKRGCRCNACRAHYRKIRRPH